jgi:general secretion pathway protein J
MFSRPYRGFTLIELLVALFILAILATAGYRGLNAVLQTRAEVAQETRKWQHLMFFFSRMQRDLAQPLHRPIRGQSGSIQPEFLGLGTVASANQAQLTFTRAGAMDEGDAQMVPQRIGYLLEGNTIVLLHWPALDQPINAEPQSYPLLSGVSEFNLRYLTASGNWYQQWPPAGGGGGLPAAVEIGLTLTSGEKITRIFALQ